MVPCEFIDIHPLYRKERRSDHVFSKKDLNMTSCYENDIGCAQLFLHCYKIVLQFDLKFDTVMYAACKHELTCCKQGWEIFINR